MVQINEQGRHQQALFTCQRMSTKVDDKGSFVGVGKHILTPPVESTVYTLKTLEGSLINNKKRSSTFIDNSGTPLLIFVSCISSYVNKCSPLGLKKR